MPLLEDGYKKQEKINGIIFNMSPSADYRHGTVNLNIYHHIKLQLKDSLCMVFVENLDFIINEENGDYVIPDVMVICDKKHLKKGNYQGVPKFIVETLSPSTAARDRKDKKEIYAAKGVEEYWIVDPKAHSLETYHLKNSTYQLVNVYMLEEDPSDSAYNAEVEIALISFPNIRIVLSDIFADTF